LVFKPVNALWVVEKYLFEGLFKNAQMQGAQKSSREAYIDIRRAVRFAAQHSR
jgi:hypothetical protein